MRKLTTLQQRASDFSDVLDGNQIGHSLDATDAGTEVWVLNDSDLPQARSLLQSWTDNPDAAEFADAAKAAAAQRAESRARAVESIQRLSRQDRAQRAPTLGPVTVVVIGLSVLLTLLGVGSLQELPLAITSLPSSERVAWAFTDDVALWTGPDGPFVPFLYNIRQGEVWRLITPIFVHVGGLFHLGFNAYWFWHFGRQIETRKGSLYLLALVVGTGVLSMLAQYSVGWALIDVDVWLANEPMDFGLLHRIYLGGPTGGGLSGVVYGLFGTILAKSALDKFSGLGISSSTAAILGIWLLICFAGRPVSIDGVVVTHGLAGNIANIAHLAGLVVGLLWGAVGHRIRKPW
ncbi:MAG: rhomboid family intramembrane serine protease [Myxococcota bacterium]